MTELEICLDIKLINLRKRKCFFLLQTNSPSGNFNVRKEIMKQILLLFFFLNSVAGELMKSWISVFLTRFTTVKVGNIKALNS